MVGCLKAFCGRNAFFCNYLKELNGFKKGREIERAMSTCGLLLLIVSSKIPLHKTKKGFRVRLGFYIISLPLLNDDSQRSVCIITIEEGNYTMFMILNFLFLNNFKLLILR
jgi:hypothetical protein